MLEQPVAAVLQGRDSHWWCAVVLVGVWPIFVRSLLLGRADRPEELAVTYAGLFLGGSAVGLLRPVGLWRWAVAVASLLALADLACSGPLLSPFTAAACLNHVLENFNGYLLAAVVLWKVRLRLRRADSRT